MGFARPRGKDGLYFTVGIVEQEHGLFGAIKSRQIKGPRCAEGASPFAKRPRQKEPAIFFPIGALSAEDASPDQYLAPAF